MEASPGADTAEGNKGTENGVVSSMPGGSPTFVIVLVLLALAIAAWATWWLRSRRPGSRG